MNEKTRLEVKGIKVSTKRKLKALCAKKGYHYADWIEEKLSTEKV